MWRVSNDRRRTPGVGVRVGVSSCYSYSTVRHKNRYAIMGFPFLSRVATQHGAWGGGGGVGGSGVTYLPPEGRQNLLSHRTPKRNASCRKHFTPSQDEPTPRPAQRERERKKYIHGSPYNNTRQQGEEFRSSPPYIVRGHTRTHTIQTPIEKSNK